VGHGELFRLLPGGTELGVVGNGDVLVWDGTSVRRA
jgi:probable phosphoglycerate mutase